MRLQEAPMSLRLDNRQHLFDRHFEPAVNPGRQFPQPARLRRLENQQVDDLLHPGRTHLGCRCDDDIALTRFVARPSATVATPVPYDSCRCAAQHGNTSLESRSAVGHMADLCLRLESKRKPASSSISLVRINVAASLVVPFPAPQVSPRSKTDRNRHAIPAATPRQMLLYWVWATNKQNLIASPTARWFHPDKARLPSRPGRRSPTPSRPLPSLSQ